jgi:hypothetical protein
MSSVQSTSNTFARRERRTGTEPSGSSAKGGGEKESPPHAFLPPSHLQDIEEMVESRKRKRTDFFQSTPWFSRWAKDEVIRLVNL